MKILYIAKERGEAEVAATSLRSIAQNVTVLWASRVDRAANWIPANRDLAALVVEAQVDVQGCASFLKHVRSLGVRAAVVVFGPEEAGSRLESLQAGPYHYVAKDQSLFRNLPVVVRRAIERAQTLEPGRWGDVHFEAAAKSAARAPVAEQRTEYEARLATAMAASELAQTVAGAQAALERAERARASDAAAAAERLAQCQAEFDARLAEAVRSKSTLERRLGDLEASFHQLEQSWAIEQSAAAERQTKLEGLVDEERAARANLEQKLAHASAALQDAEHRHQSAMTTAAEQLAERQAQYDVGMARAGSTWQMVDEQLREAAIEVKQAREHQASTAADVDRLTRRESERSLLLAEVTAAHSTLKGQLADAEAALEAANGREVRERLAAAEQATERQTEFETQLEQEVARRRGVEEQLAHSETARHDAEQRHASAMTTAAAILGERQAQFDAQLTEAAAARNALACRVRDLEAALGRTRQDLESTAAVTERLARREAELTSMLAEAASTRNTLERRLAGTETAFKDADERATRERLAATKRAAEREAELDGLIRQERVTRAKVEEKLADVEGALHDAEQRYTSAMTTAATRLADATAIRNTLELQLIDTTNALKDADERATLEREETAAMTARAREDAVRLEDQIARERLDQGSRLAELQDQIRSLALERDALQESLGTSHEQSQRANTEHREECERLEQARVAAEAEIRRLAVGHSEAQHNLATLRASVAERDAQINEQAARHSASLEAAESERTQLQDGFRTTLAARTREIEQLQGNLKATIQELDVTRSRRQVLQNEADRVPQLQKQLDESRAETLRQFEHSPLALCRCTRDGALTHANGAFADLVDYRKADELRSVEFATTVFESPDDLSSLIERCLSTRAIESIETTWRRINGGRIVVRLSAFASTSDVIEIVAEDLTNLRALQDRLGEAHRMEAVGRLASEVAVTCGNLLLDVHQDAQQWLMTVGDNTALQHRGEMLLDEVTRAASFLRQLAAYSDEETNALAPVDLNRVLRDLEPVLKRVAGDDVELELPKTSSPIDVEVKAERIERLLINLAGYGRERMPSGGRLRIELATVVVDGRFIAKYPHVRQGPHALITVTEVKRARRGEGPPQLRDRPTEPGSGSVASEKPGVDLGALQALIRECSGHLWMAVEPSGDMVVKIHLPMRASDDRTPPSPSAIRTSRQRTIGRWFHH